MRLFVAIDLNDEVRDAIATEQKRIAVMIGEAPSMKWIRPAHMHLTLVFLGEIAEATVPRIVDGMSPNLEIARFAVAFEGLGVFPPHGAPRVLWLGVGEGTAQVTDMQRHIAHRLERTGVLLERRPFHPHLTLGRWRHSRPSEARRVLVADCQSVVARLSIDSATLYQSRLSSTGPAYTPLARATLT
jgi:2'-5' RNA ligase